MNKANCAYSTMLTNTCQHTYKTVLQSWEILQTLQTLFPKMSYFTHFIYVDFKMAANENALTQPKYELGICSIIQNVFQGD